MRPIVISDGPARGWVAGSQIQPGDIRERKGDISTAVPAWNTGSYIPLKKLALGTPPPLPVGVE